MTTVNGSRRTAGTMGLLLAVALLASGCGDGAGGGGGVIAETAWTLTELDGAAVIGDGPPTIVFGPSNESTPGETFGSTGCNSFNGPYSTDGGSISMGPFITTLAGCVNPPLQAQEGTYLITLETAASYTVSGETLEIMDEGGDVTATFALFEPNLASSSWVATSINNGREAVVSTIQGTEVTLQFDDVSGLVAGSGGCNTFATAYRLGEEYSVVDGGSIEIASISSRRQECEEDVASQEDNYYAALENTSAWVIRGLDLEFRDAEGALQVQFRRADG